MLTGKRLGKAIESARVAKGISKKQLSDEFGVSPPSVQGWVMTGRIDKTRLIMMMHYFGDVVGPDHWGLGSSIAISPESNKLLIQLDEAISAGLLGDSDIQALSALAKHLESKNRLGLGRQ